MATPSSSRRSPCSRVRPITGRSAAPPRGCGRALLSRCLPASTGGTLFRAGGHTGRMALNVLFIHDAFPAQFGQLGLELTRRRGWKCSFLVQSLSSCPTPTPEMLQALELFQMPLAAEHKSSDGIPWPQIYGHYLEQCRTVHDAIRANAASAARPGRRPRRPRRTHAVCPRSPRLPDHHLLRVLLRDRASRHLVPDRPAARRARPVLPALHQRTHPGDTGGFATPATRPPTGKSNRFQSGFIPRSRSTSTASTPRSTALAPHRGGSAPPRSRATRKVVTFVSRGLESIRGFDLFMKVARRICEARSDVLFAVVGGEEIHYGWDKLHTGRRASSTGR